MGREDCELTDLQSRSLVSPTKRTVNQARYSPAKQPTFDERWGASWGRVGTENEPPLEEGYTRLETGAQFLGPVRQDALITGPFSQFIDLDETPARSVAAAYGQARLQQELLGRLAHSLADEVWRWAVWLTQSLWAALVALLACDQESELSLPPHPGVSLPTVAISKVESGNSLTFRERAPPLNLEPEWRVAV